MKLRSILISLVVSLAILGGIGGFFWFKANTPMDGLVGSLPGQNPLPIQNTDPAAPTAAMFVPKQSPVMVSLLVFPDRLESFSLDLVAPKVRKQLRTEFDQFKQGLLAGNRLDYARDVQPWIGQEMTFALTSTDLDRDASNGEQPGYLLALSSRVPDQAQEFLQLFWKNQAVTGKNLLFEQYSGVKLVYGDEASGQDGSRNNLATAMVGDRYVLFANHPKVLREAINSGQGEGLNLTSTPAYQTAVDTLSEQQVGLAVINLPLTTDWLATQNRSLISVNFNADKPKPKAPFETLLMALNLAPEGFIVDTTLLTLTGQTLTPAAPLLSEPVAALRYLPKAIAVAASGTQLNQVWPTLVAEFAGYESLLKPLLKPFQTFQQDNTLTLSTDVFPWVAGDYALGLLPKPRPIRLGLGVCGAKNCRAYL